MIKGHSKRKTIIRSSIIFVLVFSIFLSSICVSFAINIPLPESPVPFDYVVTNEDARDFAQSILDTDPNGNFIVIQAANSDFWWQNFQAILYISADTPVYLSSSSIWLGSRTGYAGWWVEKWNTAQEISYTWTPSFTNNSMPIDGVIYYELSLNYYFINNNVNAFYCSCDFKDTGGDVSANLDISGYLPPPYYLEAHLSLDKEFVWIDVNFNIDTWGSLVSLWGYNDYGATPFNYGRNEYLAVQFDMGTDGIHSIFKVPIAPFRASYLGQDFTIVSVSVMGWEDGHEEYVTVDWHLSEITPGDYTPPTSNYYTTYVYDSSYYTNLNRYVVSFGNLSIRLKADNTLGHVFWDDQVTLLTPFNYSYVFLPQIDWIDGYEQVIDELCLQFDIVFTNCPDTLVDSIYGLGTAAHMRDYLDTTTRLFLYYIGNLNKNYTVLPYHADIPSTYDSEYSCACLYTDSFYFKNLAYFFGDSNNLLLEIDERLFGEDGSFDLLFENMKKSYDNDYSYYSDMITYMNKLNYLVYELTSNDYFAKYLLHLESIDTKLGDIVSVLTAADEEDFDNRLHAPWLQIYRYFKTLFNRSLTKLPDFLDTTSEILDGGSDQVGIGFTLDNDYEQSLPLNSPSVSPTPIPIPTLFP